MENQQTNNQNLISCPSCGQLVAKSAKSCPNCGAKNKKPVFKKPWFWILIALVVIIVISVAASGGNEKPTSGKAEQGVTSAAAEEKKEQKTKFAAGEWVDINGLKVTYKSCETDWSGYDEYAKPKNGNKVIRAELEFENTGKDDAVIDVMECYADGYKCESFLFGNSDYNNPVMESVAPGKKVTGIYYFEVPSNAKEVNLQYETSYFSSKYVEFEVK